MNQFRNPLLSLRVERMSIEAKCRMTHGLEYPVEPRSILGRLPLPRWAENPLLKQRMEVENIGLVPSTLLDFQPVSPPSVSRLQTSVAQQETN
jgi:hypothetical protein